MTTSHALHLFASSRATGAAAGEAGQVAAGAAVTLAPKAAMTLRIAEGQAWVTLGQGLGDGSDLILRAGQSVGNGAPAWGACLGRLPGAPAWGDACCA